MKRAAVLSADEACRFVLERDAGPGRTVAWLMCNPSRADLWAYVGANWETAEFMSKMRDNFDALAMIGAQADVRVVAFGAEPGRRYPRTVRLAWRVFMAGAVAVIALDLIEAAGVTFGAGNSWRGDVFEPELREACRAYARRELAGL